MFRTGLVNRFLRVHMLLGKLTNYRIRSRRIATNRFRIAIEHDKTRQYMTDNVYQLLDGLIEGKQPKLRITDSLRESEWTRILKEKNTCAELK